MKIKEIAKLAGVSISTVSRVTNGYPNVPKETKDKVMSIISEHGYIANSSARILTGKKNKTLGLFIVEFLDSHANNIILPSAWFTNIIAAVVNFASAKEYNTLVTLITSKNDLVKAREMFANKSICGGIFIGAENSVAEIDELDSLGYKIALLEQKNDENLCRNNSIFVNTDNTKGAYEATKYLLERGHKKIVHIMGNTKKSPTMDRLNGYKMALTESKIPIEKQLIIKGDYQTNIAYENIKSLIEQGTEFSAIFAASDDMAFGAMEALKEKGISIPEDVSIIGYDDTIIAKLGNFSSVKAHTEDLADLLVNQLINCIENPNKPTNSYIVESKLEIRNSILEIKNSRR